MTKKKTKRTPSRFIENSLCGDVREMLKWPGNEPIRQYVAVMENKIVEALNALFDADTSNDPEKYAEAGDILNRLCGTFVTRPQSYYDWRETEREFVRSKYEALEQEEKVRKRKQMEGEEV